MVTGAIQALDAEIQLNGCVTTLDPLLCNGITRTAGGVINGFENALTNIGGIETSGYDVKMNYVSPETSVGQFLVTWMATRLDDFTQIVPTSTGFVDVPLVGTEVGDPERAFPELKWNLMAELFKNSWSVSANLRFIDEVIEQCSGLTGLGLCSDEANELNKIDSTYYMDLQGTWRPSALDSRLTLTLGINNVLDEDPPPCYSCALNGFDATTWDVPGTFTYVRAIWRTD